ncbi:MAG: hypothetical protein ACF8NJ_02595 [Phycisphaerales bacterium JB038]
MRLLTNGQRYCCAGLLLFAAAATATAAPTPGLMYDSVLGVEMVYQGDLDAGTLTFTDVKGWPFLVDRMGMGVPQLGSFDDQADFTLTLELINYHNGVATFTGAGDGPHQFMHDEDGRMICVEVPIFQLTTSGLFDLQFEGSGSMECMQCSDDAFQDICTLKHCGMGEISTWAFNLGMSLEDYLATNGSNGLPLRLENLQIRMQGDECWGDVDCDGDCDQTDLGTLLASYGRDDGGDLNCDGVTDQIDLGILLASYGYGS